MNSEDSKKVAISVKHPLVKASILFGAAMLFAMSLGPEPIEEKITSGEEPQRSLPAIPPKPEFAAKEKVITLDEKYNIAAARKPGDQLENGTIYAGNGFIAAPKDAPRLLDWDEGKRYCENLVTNGHNDWQLPTKDQLDHLYQNRNTGDFAGTFVTTKSGVDWGHWYRSRTEWDSKAHAWNQNFTDGSGGWSHKNPKEKSVRCVHKAPQL